MPAVPPKAKYAARVAVTRARGKVDPRERRIQATARRMGEELSERPVDESPHAGPQELRDLGRRYRLGGMETVDGRVPLLWWTIAENYGDLLSPWLVRRMTGVPVVYAPPNTDNCVAVGSIVNHSRRDSTVWGSGLMGWETKWLIPKAKKYAAVRGPITRSVLRNLGYEVPRVYGDPALLAPVYYYPEVDKTHEVGIVVRWSERQWQGMPVGDGVKLINLHSSDVEGVTRSIMSCERIVSSSLHGLVIADAYAIPNAWLNSDGGAGGSRPGGGEFKFYDYFASVNKLRHAQDFHASVGKELTPDYLLDQFWFDDQLIDFDHEALLDACPFVERAQS
jgi:pyruvyltransferase